MDTGKAKVRSKPPSPRRLTSINKLSEEWGIGIQKIVETVEGCGEVLYKQGEGYALDETGARRVGILSGGLPYY